MMRAYRLSRGALAGSAMTALVLFVAWHVLVWRMGEVYRYDSAVHSAPGHAKEGQP